MSATILILALAFQRKAPPHWEERRALQLKLEGAAEVGDVAAVRSLLRQGADANGYELLGLAYGGRTTALTVAMFRGHGSEVAKVLLAAGADPNRRFAPKGKVGITPLMMAVRFDDPESVALLLRYHDAMKTGKLGL